VREAVGSEEYNVTKRAIVKVSGGKDSVAMWLWARRTGLDPIAVYEDTKFEWKGHYAVLDDLERRIAPIVRIQSDKSFLEWCRHKGTFPSRVRKWCTEELKLKVCRLWLDHYRETTGEDVQLLLGIRREESAKRADPKKTPEREFSDFYDCEVWRPILDWTVQDVIAEHHRAGVPMHPLYHEGAERVGCFPCVNAGKTELALVARLQPERIDEIRLRSDRPCSRATAEPRSASSETTGHRSCPSASMRSSRGPRRGAAGGR
jgi:3'-phosphoadenosine 5'-phosphosulfate sulfotransferase (PAPS reductase)/FAD synthetase